MKVIIKKIIVHVHGAEPKPALDINIGPVTDKKE